MKRCDRGSIWCYGCLQTVCAAKPGLGLKTVNQIYTWTGCRGKSMTIDTRWPRCMQACWHPIPFLHAGEKCTLSIPRYLSVARSKIHPKMPRQLQTRLTKQDPLSPALQRERRESGFSLASVRVRIRGRPAKGSGEGAWREGGREGRG